MPGGTKGKRGPRTDSRTFLEALLWMERSGGRWRDLPERLGDYRSVKRRYYRWIEMGVPDSCPPIAISISANRQGNAAQIS